MEWNDEQEGLKKPQIIMITPSGVLLTGGTPFCDVYALNFDETLDY